MPRYFFNTDGDRYPPDQEGTVLPGPDEALNQAIVLAGEMLKDINGQFWGKAEWRLEVTDEEGSTVCALTVRGDLGPRQ